MFSLHPSHRGNGGSDDMASGIISDKKRRSRYGGLCLHCLTESCVPMYRHVKKYDWGHEGSEVHGIVWTCWMCGSNMFWHVERSSFTGNRKHEIVVWSVELLDAERVWGRLQPDDDIPVMEQRGDWFQPVASRTETLSRFGEVWTSLNFGWNDGALPFSGDFGPLPIGGP